MSNGSGDKIPVPVGSLDMASLTVRFTLAEYSSGVESIFSAGIMSTDWLRFCLEPRWNNPSPTVLSQCGLGPPGRFSKTWSCESRALFKNPEVAAPLSCRACPLGGPVS